MSSDAFHVWLVGWLTCVSLCIPALIIVLKQGIHAYGDIRELIIDVQKQVSAHENDSPGLPSTPDRLTRD